MTEISTKDLEGILNLTRKEQDKPATAPKQKVPFKAHRLIINSMTIVIKNNSPVIEKNFRDGVSLQSHPIKTYHMEPTHLSHSDYSIYPGEYVPLFSEEDVKEELKHISVEKSTLPPANVTELQDSYAVEVAIPGVKREELFIHADKNVLAVSVMHSETMPHKGEKFHLHEFNYQCFDRQILLPEDVDASFARAEYCGGMLRMHVPKTKQLGMDIHTKVVVY